MNKNPFLNATLAVVYIVILVFIMFKIGPDEQEDTILMPITMLSIFVLSAAVMGYLFIYRPLELHLDNQRKEAITFFLKTIGTFACFIAIFLGILLYTSFL